MIHYNKEKDDVTIMSLYVNNFLIAAKHYDSLDWLKSHL